MVTACFRMYDGTGNVADDGQVRTSGADFPILFPDEDLEQPTNENSVLS